VSSTSGFSSKPTAHRTAIWFAALVVCALAGAAWPAAIERTRLPQFQLTARDGRIVPTTEIGRTGRWLMIYLPPECGSCDELLRAVVKAEHPRVPAQLVIVVGAATADRVQSAAEQFPDLAESSWYADPFGASIAPLQLGTTPAIFGVNGVMIEWSVSGVLSVSPEMKSLLANWVGNQ
jgi:hypothetical protein